MIREIAVVAALCGGLVFANAGLAAAAGSGGYGGEKGCSVCSAGQGPDVSIGSGNKYIYNPQILGNLLNLLSPPAMGGGGGNGGGNSGGNS
ncbi:hypothetical protein OG322_41405 (plasmid) [Streptomyces sp. NBC_01260]|uniref:hypothetical protein n=1 Tax=unclassified Streptomyces TaxID=2593676 RepID=UPI000F54E000|nr:MULTISPECIES: hypothetical protein [unclassified Streptomyces]ROQ72522.1 hypothetical protein EDD95_5093 [Streptomyces sp. CEV 2-1]RPK28915.1 hypothetical protein EES39_40955 [Streptomyces sp. ADI92-24]